jgi:uncharacterized damage-inducible protein DinB
MNPYAAFLKGRDPVALIRETPGRLRSFVNDLGAQGLERSFAPGKWSVRQILCHLADTEIAFAFRLRQARAEAHHVIQPFDQDLWARSYEAYDAESACRLFTVLREWNLLLIANLAPDELNKPLSHPERGPMTYQVIVETMAGHDQNHLAQIESIAK